MKIFPAESVKRIDAATMEYEPIASIDLMERAARLFTEALLERYPGEDISFAVFAGMGNNGGDALAVARMLLDRKRDTSVWLCSSPEKMSPDCACNYSRLLKECRTEIHLLYDSLVENIILPNNCIIVDGLFGSGLNRPVTGFYADIIQMINTLPNDVVAIDIPSGLMSEDNTGVSLQNIIRSNVTFTFQFPKLAMLFAENDSFIGELHILDIGLSSRAIAETDSMWSFTDYDDILQMLPSRRRKHAHKGDFGRALLIAGSQGMAGASLLAARAALRSGVGLLTVHVPRCNNVILQTAVPEAVTSIDVDDTCFSSLPDISKYNAIAIGPGLGRNKKSVLALRQLLEYSTVPLLIDADALNIISENPSILGMLPEGCVITPHPGEFVRLAGKYKNSYEAFEKAALIARKNNIYIVLKGAYTAIFAPDGRCCFNSTGNPGMATAGSGDVLVGVILALLAQGLNMFDALCIAVYVHGLSGNIAAESLSETALVAGDIVDFLPLAWQSLEKP